jgi:molybdopterin converting factor small subunit
MQVKVRFTGMIRHYTGEKEKIYDMPEGAGLSDLLLMIGKEYGFRLPHNMWDGENERFHPSIRATRRGAPLAEDDQEPLNEGDEIYIHSRMAGG